MNNIVFIIIFVAIIVCALAEIQILLVDKKISYIEQLLHQHERLMDLHYMNIEFLDARISGNDKKFNAVKDQFDKYCEENGLNDLEDEIDQMANQVADIILDAVHNKGE